jgi:L-iditol 2-dehydrogenase
MDDMRAARIVAPRQIECETIPIVEPVSGQVLVRTTQASICGSDLHVLYDEVSLFEPPAPPGFPGHEGFGEVVESRDPAFSPGDRVLTCPWPDEAGCFADYQTLPAGFCLPLPAYQGPAEHLMMAQQLGTTIFALRRNRLDLRGKTVMVMGLGSAGCFFSYLARRAGAARVIASDLSPARVAAGRHFGVDTAVEAKGEDVLQAVMDETGGQGVDFLIEAVGTAASLLECVQYVRVGGEMLLFGLPDTAGPVPFDYAAFFRKKLLAYCEYGAQHEPELASFKEALGIIAGGELDVGPILSHVFSIEDIGQAMRLARERGDNALKVSLHFD